MNRASRHVLALLLLAVPSTVFAASSGSVMIAGKVPGRCDFSVQQASGTIAGKCDGVAGYTVTRDTPKDAHAEDTVPAFTISAK